MVYWGREVDFFYDHPVQVPGQDDTWGGTYVFTHLLGIFKMCLILDCILV